MEDNKLSSIIMAAIWIIILTLLITGIIYPMADKMVNNFKREKIVELDKLTTTEEDTIYAKLGQSTEDPILTLELKEMYAIAKAASQTGYCYEVKFTISKEEFKKLNADYPIITSEEVTNINMKYRLDTENENADTDGTYICTYRAGNAQDDTSDEIMDIINEKYKDKRQSLGMVVFLGLLVVNVIFKYSKKKEF